MLTLEKFEEASEVVKKVAIETKLLYSPYFSERTGNKVYLKPENMQVTGRVQDSRCLLQDQYLKRRRALQGIDYRSAGNHAQGVAYAAKALRRKSGPCDADHHAADEGGAYQELWR